MRHNRTNKGTICLVNLGCHKNQVDSEIMCGVLDDAGYEFTSQPDRADIIIINTCGFLKAARDESVEMVRCMSSYRKKGCLKKLVIAGCMADEDRHYLIKHVPQIDQFVSPFVLDRVAELIQMDQKVQPPVSSNTFTFPVGMRWVTTPRSYGFVKISDGCDNCCAYCRIPRLRGPFKSKSPDDILAETRELIDSGRHEIVVISQDTTSYGKDVPEYGDLTSLLSRMVTLPGLKWLRLMYLFPAGITESLLDFVADHPVVCRYLDIPLQHTEPAVLKRMNRRLLDDSGNKKEYVYNYLQAIRRRIPGVAIRSTLMTGYPGETESAFYNMMDMVDRGAFDHLGVFPWSPEPDTPAFSGRFEAVDSDVAEERAAMLLAAQAAVVESRNRDHLGHEFLVVIDGPDATVPGHVLSRTEFQAPEVDGWVRVPGEFSPGTWLNVRLTGVEMYDYEAEVLE
jgi:ribosomal protein S12 methylthiotransferase